MDVELSVIKQAYHKWKELNDIISNETSSRKVNLPEAISENIACNSLGFTRNMGSEPGDAHDKHGNLIEVKATANFTEDLTSFSPTTNFDKLIFVRLNQDEDKAYIYDLGLNGKTLGKLPVNNHETVADQQRDGRRPRLSLIDYIDKEGLEPTKTLDLTSDLNLQVDKADERKSVVQQFKATTKNSGEYINVELSVIKQAYHKWKELNDIISNETSSRKVNLPEAISENIACNSLGFTRNMGSEPGDAHDKHGNLIEVKATANFTEDLTSFSPTTNFDKLIFVRLNQYEDKAYIYDLGLNGKTLGELPVNNHETVADQQREGRRPRLSLIDYIDKEGLKPTKILDLTSDLNLKVETDEKKSMVRQFKVANQIAKSKIAEQGTSISQKQGEYKGFKL